MDGPVHGLSAGGLQGASCQKQGAGEGLECSVLTWPPAGDVPVMCWRGEGGYCPSQGGGQNTSGHWDCLRVNYGHVYAKMVRF